MKISCQSCEAKYTIADEKVRGKVVKIRCKKCGTTIVVNGNELAPEEEDVATRVFDYGKDGSPIATEEWTVNVAEGDQRSLSTAQLVELYASGVVNDETYAWRDGMDDWLPIAEIEALKSAVSAPAAAPAGPRPAAGTPAFAPPPAAGTPAFAPPPAAEPPAPGPMFASPSSPSGGAARRSGGRGGSADLFGSAVAASGDDDIATSASASPQMSDDQHDKMTGARNENSVLFSLSALTATAPNVADAKPARPKPAESSGILDIKNLAAPAGNGSKQSSKVDDIMNLGGGGMFAPALAVPVLAPPATDFTTAPAPPEDGAPAAGGGGKNKGLILGVAAIGAVAVIGVAAILVLGGKKDDGPKPVATADTATAAPAPPPTAPTAPTATAAPTPPADTAGQPTAVAANPADPPAVAPGSTPAPKDKDKPATTKDKDKPAAPGGAAAPTPTPAAPTPPPPAATTAAPAPAPADGPAFDRAAAMSALSGAASAAQGCKKPDGPTGAGRISVTFAPSGNVTTANVEGAPFAGTAVGGCVAARFRGAHVPPFSGGTVTVHKSFSIN